MKPYIFLKKNFHLKKYSNQNMISYIAASFQQLIPNSCYAGQKKGWIEHSLIKPEQNYKQTFILWAKYMYLIIVLGKCYFLSKREYQTICGI